MYQQIADLQAELKTVEKERDQAQAEARRLREFQHSPLCQKRGHCSALEYDNEALLLRADNENLVNEVMGWIEKVAAAQAEVTRLRDALIEQRDYHQRAASEKQGDHCATCGRRWPCPQVVEIDAAIAEQSNDED